jgi:hypothetical protein
MACDALIGTDKDRMRVWTRRRSRPYDPGAGKEHQHAIHRLLLRFGPVMQQVRDEARRRKVDLIVLPTAQAIGVLARARAHTNAVLHLTC